MCSHESTSTSFTYLSLCVQGATGCAGPPVLCCPGRSSSCKRECFCDEACVESGDCCPDYSSTCGQCKWRQTQRLEIHTFTFDYKCSRCKQRLLKKLQHYICNNIITASLSQHPPFRQHFLPSLLSQLKVCHHLRAISKIHIYTFTLFVLLLKKVSNHQMFKLL